MVAAVRCRASLDVGVEAVFMGAAPGYRLEKMAQTGKTADAAEDVKRRGGGREEADVERGGAAGRGNAVERLLEEVRREFSGLPVYIGVEEGYVKRTALWTGNSSENTPRLAEGSALDSTGGVKPLKAS
jgi:hypothetical protein